MFPSELFNQPIYLIVLYILGTIALIEGVHYFLKYLGKANKYIWEKGRYRKLKDSEDSTE